MEILEEIRKIKPNFEKIIWIAILAALLSFLFTLFLPLKYRSSAEILVIQKQTSEIDPYTSAKSSERVAETLTKVIYSSAFFDKVLKSGYEINEDAFSEEEIKKRKEWKKTVETKIVRGTGIFKIDVYHEDKEQAEQIAQGIVYVLDRHGQEFHGGGDFIAIKTIDYPLTSKRPVKPNLILNILIGFVLGLALGAVYVFLKPVKNFQESGPTNFHLGKTALTSEVTPPKKNDLFKKSDQDSFKADKEARKKLEKFRKEADKWTV